MSDELLAAALPPNPSCIINRTTEIVSAYVGNNTVDAAELPNLIHKVHASLKQLGEGKIAAVGLHPAVPVEESVTDDYVICLEDGKQFKSLKRHLRTKYDLTPEAYREKWGLPFDYPMVAPAYARQRSKLAKDMRLGKSK